MREASLACSFSSNIVVNKLGSSFQFHVVDLLWLLLATIHVSVQPVLTLDSVVKSVGEIEEVN